MRKTNKIIVALVLLAALVSVLAIRRGRQEATSGSTIKIGVILPLTGDAASYGEPARNGFELAREEINSAGGVNGKSLEFIYEDGRCNGTDAVNAGEKLVNAD